MNLEIKCLNLADRQLKISERVLHCSTTTPDQSGPESNGNEKVLHIT